MCRDHCLGQWALGPCRFSIKPLFIHQRIIRLLQRGIQVKVVNVFSQARGQKPGQKCQWVMQRVPGQREQGPQRARQSQSQTEIQVSLYMPILSNEMSHSRGQGHILCFWLSHPLTLSVLSSFYLAAAVLSTEETMLSTLTQVLSSWSS